MQFTQDMSKPILEHFAAVRVTMNSGISEEAEIVSEISRREIDSQVLLTMDGIIFEVTDAMKSSLISKPPNKGNIDAWIRACDGNSANTDGSHSPPKQEMEMLPMRIEFDWKGYWIIPEKKNPLNFA
ncbi:unnamed protein product [Hermetia illucens]|uniref:Uncharacterized protein n=1 Tax=Hermetia illucens TaxID=343691 RepID=A0A7R8ULL3_HERIL|nr:unnamed protein product [Hermetia illucens]